MGRRVMIVAGEASGDMYGARLVAEANRLDRTVAFFGIGGPAMRAAGVDTLVDASDMAVMGLVEVFGQYRVISRAFATLKDILRRQPPDLLVLIDYPGFNLRLARVARQAGVRILYYISPKVWAWRAGRAKEIARLVDRVAVIFPFEVPIYRQVGGAVTFVGHPLVDMVQATMSRPEAQAAFGIDSARPVVGLFPGSRRGEVRTLLPVILQAARQLRMQHAGVQFILPLAPGLDRALVDGYLAQAGVPVTVVADRNYDVIQVCDAIIAVSGTVTLEIAFFGVPMVIIYKVAPLTYAIGKRVVRVAHIGICNIVGNERIVPELIQHDAEPVRIAAEISRFLTDAPYAAAVAAKLRGVRDKLGNGGASARVAKLAIDLLKDGPN